MENKEENKNMRPYRMRGVAFPKAKYGAYIAIALIILILIILYKDSIF